MAGSSQIFKVVINLLLIGISSGAIVSGIHISLGEDPNEDRIIQWISEQMEELTVWHTDTSGHNLPHLNIDVVNKPLTSSKNLHWIQRATLKKLKPGSEYHYSVGKSELSSPLSFTVWKNETKVGYHRSPMTFLFYGSIEKREGQTSVGDRLLEENVLFGHYDGVINLGSLSCNRSLVSYLSSLQHVAGTVVYLTTPGENERIDDYSMYSKLFSMPDVPWPMTRYWYSFNTQFAHIVSFNTELYFPELDMTRRRVDRQLDWLRNDLKIANDQRTGLPDSRPWIIAYSHRALYCSGHLTCIENSKRLAEIEKILHEFGVDLVITTQHDVYERTWPVYMGKCTGKNYVNPRAPVHVASAAFTCLADRSSELIKNSKFSGSNMATPIPGPDWSAFKLSMVNQSTFGMLTICNRSHLKWQENYADENQTIIDHFYLVQSRHGSFITVDNSVKATTVILGIVIVILIVLISAFLYLRFKAFLRRKAAERKMSYVNLTSSLEL